MQKPQHKMNCNVFAIAFAITQDLTKLCFIEPNELSCKQK